MMMPPPVTDDQTSCTNSFNRPEASSLLIQMTSGQRWWWWREGGNWHRRTARRETWRKKRHLLTPCDWSLGTGIDFRSFSEKHPLFLSLTIWSPVLPLSSLLSHTERISDEIHWSIGRARELSTYTTQVLPGKGIIICLPSWLSCWTLLLKLKLWSRKQESLK